MNCSLWGDSFSPIVVIQFTNVKCTIHWCLDYSQSCVNHHGVRHFCIYSALI